MKKLILLVLLFISPAIAQQTSSDFLSILDDQNDVILPYIGAPGLTLLEYIDIREWTLTAQPEVLVLEIQVTRDWQSTDPPYGPTIQFNFTYDDIPFRVANHPLNQTCPGSNTWLEAQEPAKCIQSLDGLTKKENGKWIIGIPRTAIRSNNDNAFSPGDSLRDLQATVEGNIITPSTDQAGIQPSAFDKAPESPHVLWTTKTNEENTGKLRLEIENPQRFSNGIKTAYLFQATAYNTGDGQTIGTFTTNAPENWFIELPEFIEIPGKQNLTFPIVIDAPFRHEHGSQETIKVELNDASGVSTTQIQIVYTEKPHLSGHHSTTFFHTREEPNGQQTYWISPEVNQNNAPIPLQASLIGSDSIASFKQEFRLESSNTLGLQFDSQRQFQLALSISASPVIGPSVIRVFGEMQCKETTCENVELFDEIASNIALTETPKLIEFSIKFPEGKTRFSPEEFQNLKITVLVRPENLIAGEGYQEIPGHAGPTLHTGESSISFPLHEYHDQVELPQFSTLEVTPGSNNRIVNPGGLVNFQFELESRKDLNLELKVVGDENRWTSLTHSNLSLKESLPKTIAVSIAPPIEAEIGSVVDAILIIKDQDEPWVSQAFQFTAIVVSVDEKVIENDERIEENEDADKETSFPFTIPLMAIVALVAIRKSGKN
jgi:hypothetical protein